MEQYEREKVAKLKRKLWTR